MLIFLSTSLIPLVRRTHRPPRSQWMVTKCCRQSMPVSYHLATFHVSLLKPAGGPRGEEDGDQAPPTHHCGQQRGLSGGRSPGLQTPGNNFTVSCGLGVYGRRSGPGSIQKTFPTPHSLQSSTGPIQIDLPPDLEEDPSINCLHTSGAAGAQFWKKVLISYFFLAHPKILSGSVLQFPK